MELLHTPEIPAIAIAFSVAEELSQRALSSTVQLEIESFEQKYKQAPEQVTENDAIEFIQSITAPIDIVNA